MFNDDKTDFIVIASRHRLKKDYCQYHQVGDCDVAKMNIVQNLGAWFNDQFTMAIHITKTCSAAFYHLHNLRRIRKYLSMNVAVTLNLLLPLFLFLLHFFSVVIFKFLVSVRSCVLARKKLRPCKAVSCTIPPSISRFN